MSVQTAMCKHTAAANRTCAFGCGSNMYVGGQARLQVCGHVAVRCRWGSNPAGPPTGRHCVPNSGRRCVRLTSCTTVLQGPLNVELGTCSNVGLVVVAATYSSFGLLGLSDDWVCPAGASTRAGGINPGPGRGVAVVSVMWRDCTLGSESARAVTVFCR